jgi:hypothetical protein
MRWATFALIALAGCVPQALPSPATPSGPPARIDVARAIAMSPFAPVLARYDADIATLRSAAGAPASADLSRHLDDGSNVIARELGNAAARARAIDTRPLPPQRQPQNAGVIGSDAQNSFDRASAQRLVRANELRDQQLREGQADLAYDFERGYAGRRLVLRVKLRNLYLDAQTRRRYQQELQRLDAREAALIAIRRARDAATLSAYAGDLRAQSASDSAALASELHAHNIAVRAIPQQRGPVVSQTTLRLQKEQTIAAFGTASGDLRRRFRELRSIHDRASHDLGSQITALVRERDALRGAAVAWVLARARQIATGRGLGQLYSGGSPPAGARDLTTDVARSMPKLE